MLWQARLVPGPAGCGACLQLQQELWWVGQAFGVAVCCWVRHLVSTAADTLLSTGAHRGCPPGVLGHDSHWRGASLGGSSGKRQGGVGSVSKVDGQC